MAKQKNKQPTPAAATPAAAKSSLPKPQPGASDTNSFFLKNSKWLLPGGIALLTFLFLSYCLQCKFTNWDDLGYVLSNALIKDCTADGIKAIFSVNNPVMGNYHPLTILTYAIEFSFVRFEPMLYHFDSLICHVLVTVAVFYFIKVLTGRLVAAGVTALLFGLHPMHIESVAWVAGRKDLLYGLFYILSCTTYILYLRATGTKRIVWYVLGIVFFGISLLAKSVAVSLPVTLFVFDYLEKRNWKNIWILVEKIPHFSLALLFGILSIDAQKKIGAYGSLDVHFNPLERTALGMYALCTYLWKAVMPVGLCNFYPYPLKENDALPTYYYVYIAAAAALAFVIWKYGRKNKIVLAGLAYFLINIVLLLQFLPVGGAIISDRYGYIPYLGLFLIAGWFVSEYFEKNGNLQTGKTVLAVTLVYCLALGFMSHARCKVWTDSISLWNDNIAKHPEAPVAYFYLGQEYFTRYEAEPDPNLKKNYADSAMYNFSMSVARKPDYISPLVCIAELQRNFNQPKEARDTYLKALKINDKSESVYLGLGVVYSIMQQYDSAEAAFKMALKIKPLFPEAHSNYANFLNITNQIDASLKEYGISIAQNPDAYIPYMNRGDIYLQRLNKPDEAIADYNQAVMLQPDRGEPYLKRAKAYALKGNKAQALQDANKATSLGIPVDPAFMQQLR